MLFNLDSILSVYELLHDAIARFDRTTSFDIHGLESVGYTAGDRDLGHFILRCKAGMHWASYEIHDLEEADMVTDEGRGGPGAPLRNVRVGGRFL